ncbi:MAG TPA: hypothetical protein PKI62_04500 [bacterium]|nr:hypothetical protein [bacterium]
MKTIRHILLLVLVALSCYTLGEFVRNERMPIIPALPAAPAATPENKVLWNLDHGQAVSLEEIQAICHYIDRRYDCADFRLQSLLRILYTHSALLTPAMHAEIKRSLTAFRYGMDEPGQDGMCFWSENHQILFAAAEYLAGQYYSQTFFSNADLSDSEHMVRARKRILAWLDLRWRYGFSEYFSNTYYVQDIAPLCNLIDFCNDQEIVARSRMILDLLLYDLASQSWQGQFVTSSGRAYENGKTATAVATSRITRSLFTDAAPQGPATGMDINFFDLENYRVPQVLLEIGRDPVPRIIKASQGLDLDELAAAGLIGAEDRQIMMQWGMAAFSNPEVIDNSLAWVERNALFTNEFLYPFRWLNFTALRLFHLNPVLSRHLNPQTNGTALLRANTYTYRTPDYSLYTTQAYHPGTFGHQEHIFGATLAPDLALFHNHPQILPGESAAGIPPPSTWVGNGCLPHSVQEENINLSIYLLPERSGLLQRPVIPYTHLYLPAARFEEVRQEGNLLLARHGQAWLAFFTAVPLRQNGLVEWIQAGRECYWICVMGRAAEEPFSEFCRRMHAAEVSWQKHKLTFSCGKKTLSLTYAGEFSVDGQIRDLNYPRYESDYVRARRQPEEIHFEYQGHALTLHFASMTRTEH